MIDFPILLGIFLLTAGGSSIVCGLYAVQDNYKPLLNRLFLLISCCAFIWSLGLAVTVAAGNEMICTIGRRVAPLGWGLIFNLLLHFILLLTGKKELLKKPWIYILIYFPGCMVIFAYAVLPLLGGNPDTLLYTKLGWVNTAETDLWDWIYYSQILVYMVITVCILGAWAHKTNTPRIRKQSKLMISAFLTATIIGAVTDVLPYFLHVKFPQMSPLFIFLPITAISYAVRNYGFMQRDEVNGYENILNENTRKRVYHYITMILLLTCVINLLARHIFNRYAILPDIFILLILLTGVLYFYTINIINIEEKLREVLAAAAFTFIIPLITAVFTSLGSITIWVFTFLLILICLLFNRRIMLLSIIVSTFAAQLFVWAAIPSVIVEISSEAYFVRMGFIFILTLLAVYVHRIYVDRLKENAYQINVQKLLSEISCDFLTVQETNLDEKIYGMLKKCGRLIRVDRACLALIKEDRTDLTYLCEWCETEVKPLGQSRNHFPSSLTDEWEKALLAGEITKIKDTEDTPGLKEEFAHFNIRAFLIVPIKTRENTIGFLEFSSSQPMEQWDLTSSEFFGIIANIVSDAFVKVYAEKEIHHIAFHDQLTQLPNRILFNTTFDLAIKNDGSAGHQIGIIFIDLDFFKTFNDTLGHNLGDELLISVAKALTASVGSNGTVSRFGGDEFIAMVRNISGEKEALQTADNILSIFRKPFLIDGQQYVITASAGIALYPRDGQDLDTLIKNADIAMYKAKSQGKARYVFCSEDMERLG